MPTVTGHTTPPAGHSDNNSQAGSSSVPGGSGGKGGSGSHNPSAKGNQNTGGNGGNGQSSPGNGSTTGQQQGGAQQPNGTSQGQPASSQTSEGSSSPLVPILIAIALLAAISIGAVVIRQRRQRRSPGGQVSPKAS